MNTFWYLPLELLDERYTILTDKWIMADLRARRINYRTIEGEPLTQVTPGGNFLDWASRVHFASTQITKIARLFFDGEIQPGDIFYLADFWHPGAEGIRYIASLSNIPIYIFAHQHAGIFDPTDLVRPLFDWGIYQEMAWIEAFDGIFVGSEYLKHLMQAGIRHDLYAQPPQNIYVTGLPWDNAAVVALARKGKPVDLDNIVIWPHRLSPDKNTAEFYALVDCLAPDFPDVSWVISSGRKGQIYHPKHPAVTFTRLDKANYYATLGKARLLVSTAFHENYGYTIHEATALGTPILCPRRAVYPEMILTDDNLYNDFEELVAKTRLALTRGLGVAKLKQFPGFSGQLDIMLEKAGVTSDVHYR